MRREPARRIRRRRRGRSRRRSECRGGWDRSSGEGDPGDHRSAWQDLRGPHRGCKASAIDAVIVLLVFFAARGGETMEIQETRETAAPAGSSVDETLIRLLSGMWAMQS